MLQLQDYSDYRLFLKDYYQDSKKKKTLFSYRYMSQKAGIASPNFYQQVIEGKRNLTKSTVLKTCKVLRFNEHEREYFENLVFFNQAKSKDEKDIYFARLIELQRSEKHRIIDNDQYEYFNAWYHCIIRELVTFIDFKNDYKVLAGKLTPRITPTQAEQSVKLLLRLGFIKKKDGGYIQSDPVIKTGNDLSNYSILKFNFVMLSLFMKHYEERSKHERMCSATTLGISEETFLCVKKKIRALRTEILELARNETNPSRVYQMNINLISFSE